MGYPSWHAVEEIDKSVDDVKDFLLPFEKGTWLRMALIVIMTGGLFSGIPIGPTDVADSDFQNSTVEDSDLNIEEDQADIPDNLVLPVFGAVAGLIMLLSYLSSIFRFIFFKALDEKNPGVRRGFSAHWLDGAKYMIYRGVNMAIWAASVVLILGVIITGNILAAVIAFTMMLPIWTILFLVSFGVNNYAVPEMVVEGSGFIDSALEALKAFRKEWKQAGVFLLVKVALGIAIAMISGIVNLTALLAIGLPTALLAFLLHSMNPVLAVIPMALGLTALLAVSLAVAIPLRTYINQWILNTYAKFK